MPNAGGRCTKECRAFHAERELVLQDLLDCHRDTINAKIKKGTYNSDDLILFLGTVSLYLTLGVIEGVKRASDGSFELIRSDSKSPEQETKT